MSFGDQNIPERHFGAVRFRMYFIEFSCQNKSKCPYAVGFRHILWDYRDLSITKSHIPLWDWHIFVWSPSGPLSESLIIIFHGTGCMNAGDRMDFRTGNSTGNSSPNPVHRCRRFGRLALTDRSVGHGQYRRSVRFHLRDNTVDIDGRFGYTYGELRSISTVGSFHSTQKLVDIDHIGRLIQQKNRSTVDIDRRSGHTLKKTQKKCW